jgi:hypothetical protein
MRTKEPRFVREETCSCGASLRMESHGFIPIEDRFRWWREDHTCPNRVN